MWLHCFKLLFILITLSIYHGDNSGDINFSLFASASGVATSPPKYFSVPMHDIVRKDLYLKASDNGEVVVSYAEHGLDFKPNDYLTHADSIRFLSGSLNDFLKSQEREIVVPVIDDEDEKEGGNRVIGFVLIQPITPRKLLARRGEIQYDFKEGGFSSTPKTKAELALNLPGSKNSPDSAPPVGGGKCITSKDCFNYNGSCIGGQCRCSNDEYIGSYCQLHTPISKEQKAFQQAKLERDNIINNKMKEDKLKELEAAKLGKDAPDPNKKLNFINLDSITDYSDSSSSNPAKPEVTTRAAEEPGHVPSSAPSKPVDSSSRGSSSNSAAKPTGSHIETKESPKIASVEGNSFGSDDATKESKDSVPVDPEAGAVKKRVVKKIKPKPSAGGAGGAGGDGISESEARRLAEEKEAQQAQYEEQKQQNERQMRVEDLYGEGKEYPEPYLAGKLPRQLIHDRQRNRLSKLEFIYSVRFRSGPLGIAFDNKISSHTVIEKVTPNQQGEQSDIKPGDILIAVDAFNVSKVAPKDVLRLITTLPWPKVLAFKSVGRDSKDVIKEAEMSKKRSFNISAIYPPTLVLETSAKLAEWSSEVNLAVLNYCPLYLVKTPADSFGCDIVDGEYKLPIDIQNYLDYVEYVKDPKSDAGYRLFDRLHSNSTLNKDSNSQSPSSNPEKNDANNSTSEEIPAALSQPVEVTFTSQEIESFRASIEQAHPMTYFIIEEARRSKINFKMFLMPILKRGVCTFVQKASFVVEKGADFGILVNQNNELIDLPAGKESTNDCTKPFAVTKESDTTLWFQAGYSNEILALISDPIIGYTSDCIQLQGLVEDILEKWAHSVPRMELSAILKTKLPNKDKMRSLSDEGGRLSLSGENGWAFFDYHLAMFGPQEVPLGPLRLQVALPSPYGCDVNDYNVRIKDTVVAILRGGGCSFGIKVINAQKLGAKAVIIVNTDDTKTMRLQALPDELPLINIPCIMVSRRLQFYFEQKLKPFLALNQLMVSIQPMLYNGEYEKRNTVNLPVRFDTLVK